MSKQKYDIVDVVEEIVGFGYSVSVFACKYFYQVSNLEALSNSMDAYIADRFKQRLEYFVFEHKQLTDKEKKDFYQDLSSNKQNLNYLNDFIEKARTTTYEYHVEILAKLSVKLIKNKGLNYYDDVILSYLNNFNDEDLNIFFSAIIASSFLDPTTKLKDKYRVISNEWMELEDDKEIRYFVLRKFENANFIEDLQYKENQVIFKCNNTTYQFIDLMCID